MELRRLPRVVDALQPAGCQDGRAVLGGLGHHALLGQGAPRQATRPKVVWCVGWLNCSNCKPALSLTCMRPTHSTSTVPRLPLLRPNLCQRSLIGRDASPRSGRAAVQGAGAEGRLLPRIGRAEQEQGGQGVAVPREPYGKLGAQAQARPLHPRQEGELPRATPACHAWKVASQMMLIDQASRWLFCVKTVDVGILQGVNAGAEPKENGAGPGPTTEGPVAEAEGADQTPANGTHVATPDAEMANAAGAGDQHTGVSNQVND